MGLSNVHASFRWYGRSESAIPFRIGSCVVTTKEILQKYKTIAVVGLSSTPWRASYGVSEYMKSAGYRIIPVNPNENEVLGEKAYPTLDTRIPFFVSGNRIGYFDGEGVMWQLPEQSYEETGKSKTRKTKACACPYCEYLVTSSSGSSRSRR